FCITGVHKKCLLDRGRVNQQDNLKDWADRYDIRLEAWAPFGEGRRGTFDNPAVLNIGRKYGKTAAQVMLRWNIQRGVIVIPKSTHIERMKENFNVFDFSLSDDDMRAIAALNKNESSFFSHQDPSMVEWFVKMVEERKKQRD
ncbi:MAG: aldo/keto reductase, partial [Eubacteriales bacterium]